ncbi:MAG: flagellar hook-basal body protein [Planctomycetaceae bacterium]
MLTGLYNSASAMNAASVRQDVLSRNLAHAGIPGYKRSHVTFESFGEGTQEPNASRFGSRNTVVETDFTPGPVQQTERPLDIAIDGDGFFVLEGPNGPLLTRNGVFNRNEAGELVTSSGYTMANSPIIPPNAATGDLRIGTDGAVFANGVQVGQVEVVTVPNTGSLKNVGTTLFEAPPGVNTEPTDSRVLQGFRENANVSSVIEMIQMLAGMRHHEANSKALRTISEAVEKHTSG